MNDYGLESYGDEPLPDPLKPPRSLVVQGWVRSVGVFLLGVAATFGIGIGALALNTASEANDRANASDATTDCRALLAAEDQAAQGAINTYGWQSLLEIAASEVSADRSADIRRHMAVLISAGNEARARRLDVVEICEDGEA